MMELPHILDEFFNETSVWFMIFMLVSFLLGVLTAAWMYRRIIRVQQRQIRRLKEEIIQVHQVESEPTASGTNANPAVG